MTKTNDQKIMELRKQIEAKKEKIGKTIKFIPVTNCSIELDGVRYNLQVLAKDQIISLLVKLKAYATSAKELALLNDYTISGFNVMDWIKDLNSKLDIVCRKEEEHKLKVMESKLHKLLSNEKKVELEIDEIESMLKE
ncbi:hypothetical protein [Brevibacillus laterosporus]|uniref:hypothetical protein n=1 Tax=Brevibacillus laterosporus TaxID=1465 RepID=UPI0018F88625|nr:hypothetical protein [Brevibacillus laterosporus]MBG9773030.1 hypothetical protein [Brevibacillus laterosporus]